MGLIPRAGRPAIVLGWSDYVALRDGRSRDIVRPVGPWWREAMFPPGKAIYITSRLDGSGVLVRAIVERFREGTLTIRISRAALGD